MGVAAGETTEGTRAMLLPLPEAALQLSMLLSRAIVDFIPWLGTSLRSPGPGMAAPACTKPQH